MVLSLSPWSFRDMDPPNRMEWTPTRFGLIPVWFIFRVVEENWISVIRYVDVTVEKVSLYVNIYLQVYDSVSPLLLKMWCIQRASAFQGQRSEAKDSWWMFFPMRPFFWLVILRVEESALRSSWSVELCRSWHPSFQKPTLPAVNCFVRVACLRVPSHRSTYLVAVYSSQRRR